MSEPTKPTIDVDSLARRLPRPSLSAERAHAMRRALLDAVPEPGPPARWYAPSRGVVIGAAAALAAAGALVVLRPRADVVERPRSHPGSSAEPAAPAALAEGTTAFDAKQPIQLRRGTTTITAPAGARFDVEVRGDQVRLVSVGSGWVVVAGDRAAATIVVEHQTWQLDVASAAPAAPALAPPPDTHAVPVAIPVPPAAPVPARSTRRVTTAPIDRSAALPRSAAPPPAPPPPAPTPATDPPLATPRPSPGERDFHDGLRALFAGDLPVAVAALDRACSASSSSQDDICYWAAVAWLRSGDRSRARRGFSDMLAHWPNSTHAGEANVALGWLLLDSGDRAAARARFAAAVNDRIPSVRADAVRGLATAP